MKKRWKVMFALEDSSMWRKRLCTTKLRAYYTSLWLLRAGFNVRIERNNNEPRQHEKNHFRSNQKSRDGKE